MSSTDMFGNDLTKGDSFGTPRNPNNSGYDLNDPRRPQPPTNPRAQTAIPEHSPLPWVVDEDSGICYVVAKEIALIATLDPNDDDAPARANAELIVHCVNQHDKLVAALRALRPFVAVQDIPTIDAALANEPEGE